MLPPLSYTEATAIGLAFWLCLATVWGIKIIRVQIFEKN
ncbi:putative membrane protein [Acinetobacter sp. 479375]|nr:putative membrane protein [Acinetobacter sp. 479375]